MEWLYNKIDIFEDMPKKTKKIEKEDKEEKPQVSAKKEKKQDLSADWDIFSDGFKNRLNQFISLNKEVLDWKSTVEGTDQSSQINERKDRMAGKVEEAAAVILKEELTSLEEWIADQQGKLKEEIGKIEDAYEGSRKNLLATGSFSEDEIKNQLSNVQKKAEERK